MPSMKRIPHEPRLTGFALAEALIALLLLAMAVGAAGTALVESLAGQRTALYRLRATDLMADLAESLRAAPDMATAQAEIGHWQALVEQQLPAAMPTVRPRSSTRFDIQLQWRDGRSREPATVAWPLALISAPGES
jgi:Tfp pilus assembly protein PilV